MTLKTTAKYSIKNKETNLRVTLSAGTVIKKVMIMSMRNVGMKTYIILHSVAAHRPSVSVLLDVAGTHVQLTYTYNTHINIM